MGTGEVSYLVTYSDAATPPVARLFREYDAATSYATAVAVGLGGGVRDIEKHSMSVLTRTRDGVVSATEFTLKYVYECERPDASLVVDVIPSFPRPLSCN